MSHLLLILHLLASDIRLPGDFNARLTAITERHLPELSLAPGERPVLVDMPEVAAVPERIAAGENGAGGALAAQADRAIVVDVSSGTELYGKNEDQPAPIASITKLMVALVTLDKMDSLDQVLTVPADVRNLEELSTVVGLVPGERVSVRELLKGLLVASGNDAALTLADGLAGSESQFVDWMNSKAERIGMSKTHFANSTGLDARGGESTARNVAYLLIEASKVQRLRDLSELTSATVETENGSSYFVKSTDKLIGQTNLNIAIAKTGNEDEAGPCFGVIAGDSARQVAVVVLNSPDRFGEAERLVQTALDTYRWADAIVGAEGTLKQKGSAFGG